MILFFSFSSYRFPGYIFFHLIFGYSELGLIVYLSLPLTVDMSQLLQMMYKNNFRTRHSVSNTGDFITITLNDSFFICHASKFFNLSFN